MDKLLRSVKSVHDLSEQGRIIRQTQAHKARILNGFAKNAHILDLNVLKARVIVLFETNLAKLDDIHCT